MGLGLSGCSIAKETVEMPGRALTAVVPGTKASAPDLTSLQVALQRYADQYTSLTASALDDYAVLNGTPESRRQSLLWKVSVASAAVSIASGPNPQASLVDFLALATITRTALEQVWTQSTNGAAFQPWFNVSRSLEAEAWKQAESVFTSEQRTELRDAILRWWEANPNVHTGFFARPSELSTMVRKTRETSPRPGSIFGLVGLDPTAGLDPAVREITRSRLFAERAMFVIQRLPFLVRWQAELMTDQFLNQQPVAEALTSADRFSRAAEAASQTAAQLPDRITAEREAILLALEAQEGRLRELATEIGRTLEAGRQMSGSLNTTLVTFDALMKRFGVGEAPTHPPVGTNSPPFNILDYARTAEQITAMAQQLDALIRDAGSTLDSPALDRRIADLNALSARAKADVKAVLNHAFLLGAGLILLAFACALAYRRWPAQGRRSGGSTGLSS